MTSKSRDVSEIRATKIPGLEVGADDLSEPNFFEINPTQHSIIRIVPSTKGVKIMTSIVKDETKTVQVQEESISRSSYMIDPNHESTIKIVPSTKGTILIIEGAAVKGTGGGG
jgi:hypothetical protein